MEEQNELSPVSEHIQSLLGTLESTLNDTSIIQDNKLNFIIEDSLYRCRMPNQREKTEAEDRKNRLYIKLLQEGGFLTRKQLKNLLKENQNIDIDKMEEEKYKLVTELQNLYLTLAPKLSSDIDAINSLKEKILNVKKAHMDISLEIVNYLSPCIEDRLEKEYIEYLTYLCTEKCVGNDTWEKTWATYNDFQNQNSKLENKAVEHFVYLFVNVRG